MKSFMQATPEGWKCEPAATPKGIPITEDLLRALGCTQAGKVWTFLANGYEFSFRQMPEGYWDFLCLGSLHGHSVTHLDECFGFVAEDAYRYGAEAKLTEIRDALGIGGEVGKAAKIKTPDTDPS